MRRLLPLLLASVAVAAACGGVDRSSYVVSNLEILDDMGAYPGSDRVSIEHAAYSVGDSARRPDGYTTLVTYALAEPVEPDAVVDFYSEALGNEWELSREELGCVGDCPEDAETSVVGTFSNGAQSVSVNLDNLGIGRFEVAIDHDEKNGGVDG